MKSYFRTQWFNLIAGALNLGMFIYEYWRGDRVFSVLWLIAAATWLIMSRVDYNYDRIRYLEKKVEKYDALCDLVEALREANEIDRDRDEEQDKKIKLLEEKLR